jgi:hypothetical protein
MNPWLAFALGLLAGSGLYWLGEYLLRPRKIAELPDLGEETLAIPEDAELERAASELRRQGRIV